MKKLLFGLIILAVPLLFTMKAFTTDTVEFPVTNETLIGVLKPDGQMGYMFMVDGQLTSAELGATKCEAKLHACFKATKAEMEAFLAGVFNSSEPDIACLSRCANINKPSCSFSACNDRCFTASKVSGASSCL